MMDIDINIDDILIKNITHKSHKIKRKRPTKSYYKKDLTNYKKDIIDVFLHSIDSDFLRYITRPYNYINIMYSNSDTYSNRNEITNHIFKNIENLLNIKDTSITISISQLGNTINFNILFKGDFVKEIEIYFSLSTDVISLYDAMRRDKQLDKILGL